MSDGFHEARVHEWLADELGAINGCRLAHIDCTRIILNKTTYFQDANTTSITVEVSYCPSGVYIAKDQHTMGWIDVETTPLPVEPRDTTALSLYIRRLMDMDEDS